ncbi:hypothetical protein B0H19DRAFT_1065942 [Mycena capillaripes]|nr:hypothetical protein B0H19DRAFT_1065942 [Mycena capillaripes]
MPAGQPPLDPEARRQRRQDSRKLYNEKYRYFSPYRAMNTDLSAEMQTSGVQTRGCGCKGIFTKGLHPPPLTTARHRATIVASDYSTRRKYCEHAAEASERYRDRCKGLFFFLWLLQRRPGSSQRSAARGGLQMHRGSTQGMLKEKLCGGNPRLSCITTALRYAAGALESASTASKRSAPGAPACVRRLLQNGSSIRVDISFRRAGCAGRTIVLGASTFVLIDSSRVTLRDLSPSPSSIMQDSDNEGIDKHLYFCLPIYKPDPGHEDKDAHSASKRGTFYGVVSETWGGVLTSKHSFELKLQDHPGARTFESSTWAGITDLWLKDCEHNHGHAERERAKAAKSRRTPSPTKAASGSKVGRAPSPTKATTSGKVGRVAPSPTKLLVNPFAAHHHHCQASDGEARVTYIASMFEAMMGAKDAADGACLFYGVSGHTRIFQDRKHAWAVFKDTPGAEFFFSDTEDEVWVFVEEEAACMRGRKRTA